MQHSAAQVVPFLLLLFFGFTLIQSRKNVLIMSTGISIAHEDPCASPEEIAAKEPPQYEPEGWVHWSARGVYNMLYFVAMNLSYVSRTVAGDTSRVKDARKHQSGYWSRPAVSNH